LAVTPHKDEGVKKEMKQIKKDRTLKSVNLTQTQTTQKSCKEWKEGSKTKTKTGMTNTPDLFFFFFFFFPPRGSRTSEPKLNLSNNGRPRWM
jgi:hypothetical protein